MTVRMRHTRAHTANRRSHHALSLIRMTKCTSCGALRRPHTACASCGKYRGRVVVDVVKAVEKKTARKSRKGEEASAK